MKRLMLGIIVCVVLMFGGAGCEDGFTPEQLQAMATNLDVQQQQLDDVQAATTLMADGLAAGGIVDPNTVAKIAKLNKEADRIQAQISKMAKALADVPLTGDAGQDFIAQLQAANAASAGFNPYAVPLGIGLSGLSILLGWLARRNAKIAAKEKLKYQAHKQGAERTMKEVSVSSIGGVREVEARLYRNIGEARADLGV